MVIDPACKFSVPTCRVVRSRVVVALSLVSKAEVKPVPLREVLTTNVSITEEVANKFPGTLKFSIVDDAAFTTIPIPEVVGVRNDPLFVQFDAPAAPQALPVPVTKPDVLACRQLLAAAVIVERVKAPLTRRVSLKVEDA